jgi:N-acetylglucosaminyldiphosphoundecaprenol N-acetyl-beta-D-mannosaminyltransferase
LSAILSEKLKKMHINPPNAKNYLRKNILGVHVSAINMDQTLAFIESRIFDRVGDYICVTPAHVIMDCQFDPTLRAILNSSGLTTPDGMSLVWLMQLSGHPNVSRVYGPDLMMEVSRISVDHKWRHYFYGGDPDTLQKLTDKLCAQFPGLIIAGVYSPPYRLLSIQEKEEAIKAMNASRPDIVWVGIGSPKQEQWMADHMGKINASVLIGVGAAFDFLSGRKKQAPRWVQRSGLEWLYRLMSEPRRLWRRYAQYPIFLILLVAQAIGIKRYD